MLCSFPVKIQMSMMKHRRFRHLPAVRVNLTRRETMNGEKEKQKQDEKKNPDENLLEGLPQFTYVNSYDEQIVNVN